MEEFAIGANLEGAAARWNERERLDALAEFENFGRQTDGLRRVVSNDAVFDRHLGFHLELLSKNQTIGTSKRGQDSVEAPKASKSPFFPQPIAFSDYRKHCLPVAHGRRRFSSFWCLPGRTSRRNRRERETLQCKR